MDRLPLWTKLLISFIIVFLLPFPLALLSGIICLYSFLLTAPIRARKTFTPCWDSKEPKHSATLLDVAVRIEQFTNRHGLHIATYHWKAKGEAKGAILCCSGLDGHAESEFCVRPGLRYKGSWLEALNDDGYDVWGWDHGGTGRSESNVLGIFTGYPLYHVPRGVMVDYEDSVEDALALTALLQERYDRPVPMAIMGHRLGGTLALLAAQRAPLQAVVAISPLVGGLRRMREKVDNRMFFELRLLSGLSALLPWLPLGLPGSLWHPEHSLTPRSSPKLQAEAEKVGLPLFDHASVRARSCFEALRAAEVLGSVHTGKMPVPALVLHAEHEESFVEHSCVRAFCEQQPCQLHECAPAPHDDLLHGPQSAVLCKEVLGWLNGVLAGKPANTRALADMAE